MGTAVALTPQQYDVLIAGGGSAGVGAAVGAARAGARTLLLESAGCLGGASTLRNVSTYCGLYTFADPPRQVVYGVAEQVLKKLRQREAITAPQRYRGVFVVFDPETVKITLDEVCADAGVDVALHSNLVDAVREDDQITNITRQDHGGRGEIRASAFVDATGEANLATLAGASTRYGNDGQVNLGSLGTRFGGISPDVTVTAEQVAEAVAKAKSLGAGPFTKDKSVVVRLPISGDLVIYVASVDFDPRDSASLSKAERDGRKQAYAYLEAIRRIKDCENTYLVSTGPEFGTRESRHLNCQYQLTWADIKNRRKFNDCIALGAWGAEWHERKTFASSLEPPPDRGAYDIPLGCLVSRDTANLFAAGRTADADQKAGAAIRVMGTAFATGQAAGVAAAHRARNGDFDSNAVREELRAQGALF